MKLSWFAVAVMVMLGAGCRSQCRQLSEKLCDCAVNTTDKNTCLTNAASRESSTPPTLEDEATCKPLVDQCDCRLIDTPQGKVRCGLARPPPPTQ